MSSSQDVLNDIHGAQEVGMKGLLVRTGEQSDYPHLSSVNNNCS